VAHELRTPLTSVQGHMEAMIDGIWPMNKERLSSCYEEILRIKRLIGGIDVLSVLENENVLIVKKEFDVSKLVTRLVQNYEAEFVTKNITFKYTAKSIMIHADEDKMSQVFNNLLSNAFKYTEPGGEISFDIHKQHNSTEIIVKDTGIGISETDISHIFERFYRADKSRNSKTGGMGVGLTITKRIINAHGGTITVNSEVGVGTEFIINLPD
jgi:signal transduction histidine kinase